jgi:uncharacterized protein
LPADGASLLVVAVSGRALAASARRAGLVPLVADFFADADTRQIAQDCRKLEDLKRGFHWKALAQALEALAGNATLPPLGVVYGAGFEDRAQLLAKIAGRWPVIGNSAKTVARIKAPEIFFAELARLGVPHPRTATAVPAAASGWLAKRAGGAGGSHIVASPTMPRARRNTRRRIYFQEQLAGSAVSALFVANGAQAVVLGFSEQWASPTDCAKWRYGGAAAPATLSQDLESRMTEAVELVAAVFQLKGLGSADFLVDGDEARLLEVNPRPGATLDVFDSDTQPLLRLHLDAVLERRLPEGPLGLPEARAAAIVYAPQPLTIPQLDWPHWCADRPGCGDCIDTNRPICTVWARSRTKAEARRLVEERVSMILAACLGQEGGIQWT